MNKFIFSSLLVLSFSCGSVPKTPSKKNQIKMIKDSAKPVIQEPKAYSILDYDSEFVYIYSSGVRPPKMVVVVDDSEYYSSEFVERVTQEIPNCAGTVAELWKYKIQKDTSGLPLRGRFALDGVITKFQTSEAINLTNKLSKDENCQVRGNSEIDLINCETKSIFKLNGEAFITVESKEHRNEYGELMKDDLKSPELDFLGILTINGKDYFYLKSKNEEDIHTYIINSNGHRLNPDEFICPVKEVDPASLERVEP